MITEIGEQIDAISEICRRYRVRRLEVFGSAVDGTFDPERSDLDFLVEYLPPRPGEYFEMYFGLIESLEALFERKVDPVDVECLRNPYFIAGVNKSRTLLYDARTDEVRG